MPIQNVAKHNRIIRRANHIHALIQKHGVDSRYVYNYISDCMESDIRRERKANKELLDIINNPVKGIEIEVCPLKTQKKG